MKKYLLLFFIASVSMDTYSQDFKELYSRIDKFNSQEQYDKVDKEVLVAVNYILSNPYDRKSGTYAYAHECMIKWMDGTKKYAIIIGGKVVDDIGQKTLLMTIYMAGMAKYLLIEHLENDRYIIPQKVEGKKFMELDEVKEILYNGAIILLEYIENNPDLKLNRNTKKLVKTHKKGELHEYMFDQ